MTDQLDLPTVAKEEKHQSRFTTKQSTDFSNATCNNSQVTTRQNDKQRCTYLGSSEVGHRENSKKTFVQGEAGLKVARCRNCGTRCGLVEVSCKDEKHNDAAMPTLWLTNRLHFALDRGERQEVYRNHASVTLTKDVARCRVCHTVLARQKGNIHTRGVTEYTNNEGVHQLVITEPRGIVILDFIYETVDTVLSTWKTLLDSVRIILSRILGLFSGSKVHVLLRYDSWRSGKDSKDAICREQTKLDKMSLPGIFQFKFLDRAEPAEKLYSLGRQDFGFYFQVGIDGTSYLVMINYRAERCEQSLTALWIMCGGNIRLGIWHLPKFFSKKDGFDKQKTLKYLTNLIPRDQQPSFVELILADRYLGLWPNGTTAETFSKRALLKMEQCVLDTHWLSIYDYPKSSFNSFRESGRLFPSMKVLSNRAILSPEAIALGQQFAHLKLASKEGKLCQISTSFVLEEAIRESKLKSTLRTDELYAALMLVKWRRIHSWQSCTGGMLLWLLALSMIGLLFGALLYWFQPMPPAFAEFWGLVVLLQAGAIEVGSVVDTVNPAVSVTVTGLVYATFLCHLIGILYMIHCRCRTSGTKAKIRCCAKLASIGQYCACCTGALGADIGEVRFVPSFGVQVYFHSRGRFYKNCTA